MSTTLKQFVDEFKLLASRSPVKQVNEEHLFDRVDEIKIDPDRDDTYDVVHKLTPTLIKIAYTFLQHDRVKHERTYDEEDKFAFTKETLRDLVQETIDSTVKRLENISYKDIDDAIDLLKGEFKHPLEEKDEAKGN